MLAYPKLQSKPNQYFQFPRSITLIIDTFDHIMMKPKCVWKAVVSFKKIVKRYLKKVIYLGYPVKRNREMEDKKKSLNYS